MELPYPHDVNEWDWETVESLDGASESQYLEFKQSISAAEDDDESKWRNKIEKEIIAFANASGGILVFGVDDEGSASPFERPKHEIKQAVTRFIQNSKPLPEITIPEPIEVPAEETDRVVLPVRIGEAVRKPILTHDSAVYTRLNDREDPMSREQMESMFVAEDRRQQEIRQLEMEAQRFENILDEERDKFDYIHGSNPPNFVPLNMDSLKNALQNNTALYGKSDLGDEISEVFRAIRSIETLEANFRRETSGDAHFHWESREQHWEDRRRDLRHHLRVLHRALEQLAEEADLDVEFLGTLPFSR